ncbi:unnamed protein product [Arctia plantaginis]|uniref:Uncharacterized protein n=1 Tax=Arctia plantaginis TaxID=874455 RepID=A0A8S0ZIQ6_ARCPL|nr:unnamed protein product [Arctia plantaginis]
MASRLPAPCGSKKLKWQRTQKIMALVPPEKAPSSDSSSASEEEMLFQKPNDDNDDLTYCSSFRRERSKQKRSSKTGSGQDQAYVSKWFAFDRMKFLMDKSEPNETRDSSNMKDSYTDVDCYFWNETDAKRGANEIGSCLLDCFVRLCCEAGASETESKVKVLLQIQWSPEMSASTSSEQIINTEICEKEVPKVSTKISQSKKQKMSIQRRQEKLLDSAQILMTRQDDDWDIIGKSIGVQLKNLSTHQQSIAQKIINDALFYGKLGKLTEESIITLSPQHIASNPSRISHRSYHFSSGSSVTNSSPQPYYQQYPVQPSPQSSTQYMIPQSPQASLQHTVQLSPEPSQQYMTLQSPQPSAQLTLQPSFQPSHHYMIPQSPQISSQLTVQPSPQPSQHYMTPQSPQTSPQPYSSSSNTEPFNTEFPNCTFSDTTIKIGTGADMKDFLIFKKKEHK